MHNYTYNLMKIWAYICVVFPFLFIMKNNKYDKCKTASVMVFTLHHPPAPPTTFPYHIFPHYIKCFLPTAFPIFTPKLSLGVRDRETMLTFYQWSCSIIQYGFSSICWLETIKNKRKFLGWYLRWKFEIFGEDSSWYHWAFILRLFCLLIMPWRIFGFWRE